jgi:predicted SAM-dependent methyltransferase
MVQVDSVKSPHAGDGLGDILRRAAADFTRFFAWELLNPTILWLKRRSRYRFGSTHIGLNLGCGLDNAPGWLGIDAGLYVLLKNMPRVCARVAFKQFSSSRHCTLEEFQEQLRSSDIIHFDLQYGIPLGDGCVPYAYSAHLLEHLAQAHAEALLRECARILRPGGILRICVPSLGREIEDMKAAIVAYEQGDSAPAQEYLTTGRVGFQNALRNHRHMYDFTELKALLTACGFERIEERQFQQGKLPGLETMETRGGLYVEGTRP